MKVLRIVSSGQRSRILTNLLAQMEARADELIDALTVEGGKTQNVARGETGRAMETVRVSAEEAKSVSQIEKDSGVKHAYRKLDELEELA